MRQPQAPHPERRHDTGIGTQEEIIRTMRAVSIIGIGLGTGLLSGLARSRRRLHHGAGDGLSHRV